MTFANRPNSLNHRSRPTLSSLENPRILSFILSYLDWDDFYALSNSCKRGRLLFEHTALRDVILSRYVPWYTHALRLRDPLGGYKDVPVSLEDLGLLLTSQRIPLHQYPIHAQRILTSQSSSSVTFWLQSLTQAHSRFVLLLQAYVHSSNGALRADPEEVLWSSRSAGPLASRLRRLIFPPPLSYYGSRSPGPNGTAVSSQNGINVRRSSRGRPDGSVCKTSAALPSKKSQTFSFLRRSSSRFPVKDPATQTYSSSWKRSSIISQLSRDTDCILDEGWTPSSSHRLAQPVILKDLSSDTFPYSGSGSSSSPRSTSRGSLFPLTETNSSTGSITGSSSIASPSYVSRPQSVVHQLFSSKHTSHPMRMTSPFDISFAVSRSRAPILRVFVPCSDHQDSSQELLLCEQQLMDTGLWDHLSAGDLVCNLGYIAAEGDEADASSSTASDGDLRNATRRSENRQKPRSASFIHYHGRPAHSRRWLLFNGQFLEPHKPPQAVRIPDPLTLPTPFYYIHIMPPYTNPVYAINGLGLQDIDTIQLETRLVRTTKKVRSPHSPTGYALAWKYVWTARVLRSPVFFDHDVSQGPRFIGNGWIGEWVLEGEGTKEGKDSLLDCIRGQLAGPVEWEVVVERCGGGRVWLRLLSSLPQPNGTQGRTTIQSL